MGLFPENCTGLNSLYDYAKDTGLIETGSSSIDPSLAESCAEVRNLMSSTCLIGQGGESLNDVWAAFGDDSGILYFGGREIGGHKITAAEHLEYLAIIFSSLSKRAAQDIEKIALSFFQAIDAPPAGPVYCYSKHGTFIIPPEAYKRHMTDDELEAFRVNRDDPRLRDW